MRKIKIADTGRETSLKLAKLKGIEWEDHEGYFRTNDGDWILVYTEYSETEPARFGTIDFQGDAKPKNRWNAPDPKGFAIAQRIVELWNSQS